MVMKTRRVITTMPLTPILKKPGFMSPSTRKRVLFSVTAPDRVHALILNFQRTADPTLYSDAFRGLPNEPESEQMSWLSQMTECVPLLDRKVDKLVLEFLKIPWFKSETVGKCAESFLVSLATAHSYYTFHILNQLTTFLVPDISGQEESLTKAPGLLSTEEKLFYQRVLHTMVSVYNHVPLSHDYILVLARKGNPFFRQHVHKHAVYTHNMLLLTSLLPPLRVGIFEVLLSNMVTIDVHAPRSELVVLDEDDDDDDDDDDDEEEEEEEEEDGNDEEIFAMEIEESGKDGVKASDESLLEPSQTVMSHGSGNTLDVLMVVMLQYIHDTCHGIQHIKGAAEALKQEPNLQASESCRSGLAQMNNGDGKRTIGCECGGTQHDIEALKHLYLDLKEVFSRIILSTHATSHVQFLLFYIFALRPGLATIFLDYLRTKQFENPNCSRVVRQNAMVYIGSLLARGKFVPFSHVHSSLEVICSWCNTYLDNQERTRATNYEDLQLHTSFYNACQTIFYVFTFRYREYTENAKRLELARNLNLERLVLSQLNPLRVCAAPIVNNFAAVTRRFQLAYCYTIMENNKRLNLPTAQSDKHNVKTTLDVFFPFDPYLLLRSKRYIEPHYREFDGLPEADHSNRYRQDSEGTQEMVISPKFYDFSYGTSPGYQRCLGGSLTPSSGVCIL
ncbi:hypothetical protein Pcinc_038298 [Petrolisthes cinctipes]|uniref:RNA polymerase I-specific transcription initiation factor RRN3 n=1 Tax=Petrolisthes cinctipes TaxID=88211 RepID=A0AAE1BTZ8_PETCI|nr:hypothetical protein Pcinc_038298 [Petrolisthes cinctipes]